MEVCTIRQSVNHEQLKLLLIEKKERAVFPVPWRWACVRWEDTRSISSNKLHQVIKQRWSHFKWNNITRKSCFPAWCSSFPVSTHLSHRGEDQNSPNLLSQSKSNGKFFGVGLLESIPNQNRTKSLELHYLGHWIKLRFNLVLVLICRINTVLHDWCTQPPVLFCYVPLAALEHDFCNSAMLDHRFTNRSAGDRHRPGFLWSTLTSISQYWLLILVNNALFFCLSVHHMHSCQTKRSGTAAWIISFIPKEIN